MTHIEANGSNGRSQDQPSVLTEPITRRSALGVGLGAALGLVTGSSGTALAGMTGSKTVYTKKGGVLRIGRPVLYGTAERLDPAGTNVAYEYYQALYNRLVKLGKTGWDPVPDLAVSWHSSSDARKWTFKLRRGVTFHNGKPFTSQDAAYTFRHLLDPKTASQQLAVLGPLVDLRHMTTPDAHTLVVPLLQPHATFPSLLMNYNAYIIPDGSAATIGLSGIGTGPFKLDSFVPAGNGRVVANANYWDGPPLLDAIEFNSIVDTQARVNALLAGQVDFLAQTSLDFAEADVVKANPRTAIVALPNYFLYTMPMVVTKAPFTDVRVRQAFKLAYDPSYVLKLAAQNNGTAAYNNPVPLDDSNRLGTNEKPDVEKAKSLLRAAGHGSGVDVAVYTSDYDALFTPNALAFKDSVAAAGIRVTVKQVPVDTYFTQYWQKVPLCCSQFQNGRPISQLLSELFTSGAAFNESRWSNHQFDKQVALAQGEVNPARRKRYYEDAQSILLANGGDMVPYFGDALRGLSKQVRNYHERGFDVDYKDMGLAPS